MTIRTVHKILLSIAGVLILSHFTATFFDVPTFSPTYEPFVSLFSYIFLFAAIFVGRKIVRDENPDAFQEQEAFEYGILQNFQSGSDSDDGAG